MSYYATQSGVPSWESLERAEEDEDLDNSEYAYASRDHILFCVDASISMQTPYPDQPTPSGSIRGKSALHQVLDAVVKIERSKVITGPADSVGLLLYNIDAAHASSSGPPPSTQSFAAGNYKPGTLVYQNLRTINAEEIKRIIKLKERVDEQYDAQEDEGETLQPAALAEEFPPCKEKDELNVADVLVTCNFLFRDAGTKLAGNKRIFLVTDQDNPPGGTNRAPARTVFGDLSTYGINVNTFWVDRSDHKFDPSLYWNDILNREEEEDKPHAAAEADVDGLSALADIMNDLVIRNAPKRVQFHVPLRIGGKDGDIEIGVSGYSMISEQGKGAPKYVRMRGQQVEEVIVKTEYTSAETGAVLRPEEISSAYQFGNQATVQNVLESNWWESDAHHALQDQLANEAIKLERRKRQEDDGGDDDAAYAPEESKPRKSELTRGQNGDQRVTAKTRMAFTPDEVAQFKSLGVPSGIKIIGFQSPDRIRLQDNIRHSYFIYPDEDTYTGSTRTFAALLKSCLKRNRHALAICRVRANSLPEFCALIPQEETFTEDGGQDDPPGFHVIPLAFKDDIRSAPKNMTENLQADERQAKLMGNIIKRLRIKAGRYRSEVYPNPALAYHYAQLQALAFEEDFDLAQKIDEIDRTYPKYHGMHKAAGDFMAEWNKAIDEDERCQSTGKSGGGRGVKHEPDEDDQAGAAMVESAYKSGTLEKLRVADLRSWAKTRGVSLQGKTKKADMIELLQEEIPKHVQVKKSKP